MSPLSEGRRADDRGRIRELMAKVELIVPMDRMAEAFCAANFTSTIKLDSATQMSTRSLTAKANSSGTALGILCPEAAAETDRQILAIASCLKNIEFTPRLSRSAIASMILR